MLKHTIRTEIKNIRKNLSAEEHSQKSREIWKKIIVLEEFSRAEVVYLYADINREAATKEIIEYALGAGKEVALPKVEGDRMSFYGIQSLQDLKQGAYNIPEPVHSTIPSTPDIVFVPGVAFSYRMERLGYGGGYYDRFLTEKVLKIGLAFDFQMYDCLPVEAHDIKMDIIITNQEVIRVAK